MRKALTAKTIEALKPGPRRYDVHDVLCPGLSVRVGKQGQKTYTVKYRYGLKQRRLRLGVHPRVSLAQAREKALDALRHVERGSIPQRADASLARVSRPSARTSSGNMRNHATAVGARLNASCNANSSPRMANAISAISSEATSSN